MPDEEAARLIEAFLVATEPGVSAGVWPDWTVAETPAGLLLPDGSGVCVVRLKGAGRPVAGRGRGPLPGIRHVPAREVPEAAEVLAEVRRPGAAEAEARVVRVGPHRVVVVFARVPSAPALAAAWHAEAFRAWWRERRPSPAPVADPLPEDPTQAALGDVEGRLLRDVLRATAEPAGPEAARTLERLATMVALIRRERRAPLDDEWIALERWEELHRGLPRYVGRRCARRLGDEVGWGSDPEALTWLGRVRGGERAGLVGAVLAELLDALDAARGGLEDGEPRWRRELGGPGAPDLDALLEQRVAFDGGPRDDAAVAAAMREHGYDRLLEEERARLEEAARVRQELLDRILAGRGTLLVCDVRALGQAETEAVAPPETVNPGLVLYPRGGTFRYGSGAVIRAEGIALAHDRRSGLVHLRVRARLAFAADGADVAPQPMAFDGGLDLAIPGLRLTARAGELYPIDGGYLIRIAR